jgi:hypothetical protein
MPPKAATDGGTAAGNLTALTPKEAQMLTAVVSLMGDVPEVGQVSDFYIVCALVLCFFKLGTATTLVLCSKLLADY